MLTSLVSPAESTSPGFKPNPLGCLVPPELGFGRMCNGMKTKTLMLPVVFTLICGNWFLFYYVFCWLTMYLAAVITLEVGLLALS